MQTYVVQFWCELSYILTIRKHATWRARIQSAKSIKSLVTTGGEQSDSERDSKRTKGMQVENPKLQSSEKIDPELGKLQKAWRDFWTLSTLSSGSLPWLCGLVLHCFKHAVYLPFCSCLRDRRQGGCQTCKHVSNQAQLLQTVTPTNWNDLDQKTSLCLQEASTPPVLRCLPPRQGRRCHQPHLSKEFATARLGSCAPQPSTALRFADFMPEFSWQLQFAVVLPPREWQRRSTPTQNYWHQPKSAPSGTNQQGCNESKEARTFLCIVLAAWELKMRAAVCKIVSAWFFHALIWTQQRGNWYAFLVHSLWFSLPRTQKHKTRNWMPSIKGKEVWLGNAEELVP